MRYLREQGMEVLDRNWRCEHGEVDVVARDGDCLVICEVKTRRSAGFGEPVEAVTFAKAMRLRRLAAAYLAGHGRGHRAAQVRVDVVGILCRPGPAGGAAARRRGGVVTPGARAHPVGRAVRARRHRRRRRGAHRPGAAALRDRGHAGCRVRAGARPGAVRRGDQRGSRAAAPGHRQPLAGLDPQARRELRPGHRRRGAVGRAGSSAAASRATSSTSASWRSTGGSGACTACCPRCSRPRAPGPRHVVVPVENVGEAQLVDGVTRARRRLPARRRRLVRARPSTARRCHPRRRRPWLRCAARPGPDLADVVGQPEARLALELAATGGHHLLMSGSAGRRQDDARRAARHGAAPAQPRGGPRDPRRPLAHRPASARSSSSTARPRSSRRTTPRRWRRWPAAGRGGPARGDLPRAPRRALPRRGPGVQGLGAADPAPAARVR